MSVKISEVLYCENDYLLFFYCPACKERHPIRMDNEHMKGWQWDGGVTRPTVTPDLKFNDHIDRYCHITITNGMLHYHADSYHQFAGLKMPMAKYIEN